MRLRIEVAAARIFEHAVFHAVQRIAGFEHRFVDERIFGRRDVAVALVRDLGGPHLRALQVRWIIGGGSRDDAVVIVWDSAALRPAPGGRRWSSR